MKNELIVSSLLLTAQITPAAMASTTVQKALNKNLQTSTFKTPMLKVNHPFRLNETIELYAVFTIIKDVVLIEDLNMGKATHKVTIQLFDINNRRIEGFTIKESEDGGFYAELRGKSNIQKSYILWSCSSTMSCGYAEPGFFHMYPHDRIVGGYYNFLQLPVTTFSNDPEEEGDQPGKISLYFESQYNILN